MMQKTVYYYAFILIISVHAAHAYGRNIHRPKETALPTISVSWDYDKTSYQLQSSHLEFYPFFGIFDKPFFDANMLPKDAICYRKDPKKNVTGRTLNNLIASLLQEIKEKKRTYTNFKVITAKNFNRKQICGMMILKFNDYPFIIKLALESPQTFINPYCKGLDNVWFFPLGGGINRHLAGLTRIKNLQTIKQKLALHPQWATLIDVPRKWYWAPSESHWLDITGTNIGGLKTVHTKIPSTYCIVADEIESDESFNLFNNEQTTLALNICNYLDLWIDPHINNFMIEKNTNKIVIVDTEHFPSVVGIKEKVSFDSYTSWILYLMGKCAKDWFFRTKEERQSIQATHYSWQEFTKLT